MVCDMGVDCFFDIGWGIELYDIIFVMCGEMICLEKCELFVKVCGCLCVV